MIRSEQPTTVAIVDDHALFREGLREILESQEGLVVVGEAGTSSGALSMVADKKPDILLLDVEIPGDSATDTVTRLRIQSPNTQIIILSMYDGPQLLHRLLAAGIRGYLLKSVHWHELVSAIRSVHDEPERVVLAVSRESLAQMESSPSEVLTSKEREVLELAAQALSNRQIAARINTTEATVKRHLRNIFVKLGAASRIDAVNRAIDASLITPSRTRSDN
ncbi:response regulator [Nonomuraea angiospora]|uniref:DNA-binding NarL/FixJ family response regulator n=1 Tax=Nonomuraea angiospora TaxID=46172 RepID=A0ABR9M2C0_9ACTN|nr:response regulator transcription factor [Nonomuraea angiospora]MBE1587042.1 DNA-binding NarL/FixJ family response regulator [Nonomuraea angiospora]MDX3111524.1 response regulator transcription factor [Nonomuraea angiospora]